nr:hypothetical protein [uncultured Rhodococcus sp.]
MNDLEQLNTTVISDFRADGGHVRTNEFGSDPLILHTTGARTGRIHLPPLRCITEHGHWFVI